MYEESWAWLRNNGMMGPRWGGGDNTQSPDANLTGIYDIIVHRLLGQTVKSTILLLVLKKITTCYLEKTQTWKGSIE